METGALLYFKKDDDYLETCPECGIIEYEGCQCGLMEEEQMSWGISPHEVRTTERLPCWRCGMKTINEDELCDLCYDELEEE